MQIFQAIFHAKIYAKFHDKFSCLNRHENLGVFCWQTKGLYVKNKNRRGRIVRHILKRVLPKPLSYYRFYIGLILNLSKKIYVTYN